MEEENNMEGIFKNEEALENGVLDSFMLSYNDWAKECKKHLDTKPHVKNRWKDSTFKKCYKEGMTPKQAVSLCWLASY